MYANFVVILFVAHKTYNMLKSHININNKIGCVDLGKRSIYVVVVNYVDKTHE